MSICKAVRMTSLALCFVLITAGAGLAASFGEIAGGVKTLTESAKDVNDITKDHKETPQAGASSQKSSQKSAKKPAKKSSAPSESTRVQGG